MKRSLLGAFIALIFTGLTVSGVWLFWSPSNEKVIILHLVFAGLFLALALLHMMNNLRLLAKYFKKHLVVLLTFLSLTAIVTTIKGNVIADQFISFYARFQQRQPANRDEKTEVYALSNNPNLTLELRAGDHFWFPQIAVWASDTANNYLETFFITHSTAKGEFYGGRTKENFKQFDQSQARNFEYRRVDALPYWSRQNGALAKDGIYAPTKENPLPDAISGATPTGSMPLQSNTTYEEPYRLYVELNVAFDDNKYYSQYDFPEDTLYHNGTGLLGQPSVVYTAMIYPKRSKHYLLEYLGHTHPSKYIPLVQDTKGLTTAMEILDLGLVSLNDNY